MNRQPFILPALIVLTFARYLALTVPALTPVEAQALECAHQVDFWHTSLGPVLPLLIKLGTTLFGENTFGVRFLSPLLLLGASCLLWKFTLNLFDAITASWALVLFNLLPAVNLAAITFTPTTLGITSGIITLIALRVALHSQHPWHQPWWLLALSLVVAFMTDWRLITLSAATFLSLLLSKRGRRALLRWPVLPILAGVNGAAITVFLAWNSAHHWPAFTNPSNPDLPALLHALFRALLTLSPFLLPALGWTLLRGIPKKAVDDTVAMLYAFILPLLSLDVVAWISLPWPQSGFSAWLAPASILLAHQSLSSDALRPKRMLLARSLLLLSAALLSLLLVHGSLARSLGFTWQ